MSKTARLTHEGLSRLGINQDFDLKTDSKYDTIKCSRSQISFISPVVSKLFLIDPTIKEFTLKTKDSSKCCEIIESLLNGSEVKIPHALQITFQSISIELGNEELLTCVQDHLTNENVIDYLLIRSNMSFNTESEIEYIASHFYEFKPKVISSLSLSIIDSILSSPSLVIESEHRLFEFINDLISKHGDEYRLLFSYLHLEYLNRDEISIFIESIDLNNIVHYLPCIYRHLLCFPSLQTQEEDKSRFKKKLDIVQNMFLPPPTIIRNNAGGYYY